MPHYTALRIVGLCLAIAASGSACGAPEKAPLTGVTTPANSSTPTDSSSSADSNRPPSDKDFDPKNFTHSTEITNPYFPMTPGTQFLWKGHAYDDGEKVSRAIEFTVTDLTKTIDGVRTVVARDRDFTGGEAEEVELTFYAQDDFGHGLVLRRVLRGIRRQADREVSTWLAGLQRPHPAS